MTTAALRQALERRYKHVRDGEVPAPDLLLIDGGLGQISQVHEVLAELGFADLTLVGVAKGPERRAGPGAAVRLRQPGRRGAGGASARPRA